MEQLDPKRQLLQLKAFEELYALSGNNCAFPGCTSVIICGHSGLKGRVCFIEAEFRGQARFNPEQSDQHRRSLGNLLFLCTHHYYQVEKAEHEKPWTVSELRQLKHDHEACFRNTENLIKLAYDAELNAKKINGKATQPISFKTLDKIVPECKVDALESDTRSTELGSYLSDLATIPLDVRHALSRVVKHAYVVGNHDGSVSIEVEVAMGLMELDRPGIEELGKELKRLGLGSVSYVSNFDGDGYYFKLGNPSSFVNWFDLVQLCEYLGVPLEILFVDMDFGILDYG